MPKNHLKRISVPRTWLIERKKNTWITRPNCGAHSLSQGTSVNTLLKEMLEFAKTSRDVKNIVYKKTVLVDGKKIDDFRFNVGLMDVIEFPDIKESYRIIINKQNKLVAIKNTHSEKPCKIVGKKKIGKLFQLNLFDGKNILTDNNDYKVNDTIVITLPDNKIKSHLPFKTDMLGYLTGGNHVGEVGNIEHIDRENVRLKTENETFETKKEYVFVIGKDKPAINLT